MHHLKETTIDGVKFVLIPEELHDALAKYVKMSGEEYGDWDAGILVDQWKQFDPEIFNAL